MVGVIDEVENCLEMNVKEDNTLLVLGQSEDFTEGWIGCSVYQEIENKIIDAAPPPVNLEKEKKIIDILLQLHTKNLLTAAHDISDGGLLTAICEMLFKDNLGLNLNLPKSFLKIDSKDPILHSWCFGEDQGRIIVATNKIDKVKFCLKDSNLDYFVLGKTNASNNLNLNDITTISISVLKNSFERTLPLIMGKHSNIF